MTTSGQVDPKLLSFKPCRSNAFFMPKNKTGEYQMIETTKYRELTRAERAAIRKLVKDLCANYDHEYGCLSTCFNA